MFLYFKVSEEFVMGLFFLIQTWQHLAGVVIYNLTVSIYTQLPSSVMHARINPFLASNTSQHYSLQN